MLEYTVCDLKLLRLNPFALLSYLIKVTILICGYTLITKLVDKFFMTAGVGYI